MATDVLGSVSNLELSHRLSALQSVARRVQDTLSASGTGNGGGGSAILGRSLAPGSLSVGLLRRAAAAAPPSPARSASVEAAATWGTYTLSATPTAWTAAPLPPPPPPTHPEDRVARMRSAIAAAIAPLAELAPTPAPHHAAPPAAPPAHFAAAAPRPPPVPAHVSHMPSYAAPTFSHPAVPPAMPPPPPAAADQPFVLPPWHHPSAPVIRRSPSARGGGGGMMAESGEVGGLRLRLQVPPSSSASVSGDVGAGASTRGGSVEGGTVRPPLSAALPWTPSMASRAGTAITGRPPSSLHSSTSFLLAAAERASVSDATAPVAAVPLSLSAITRANPRSPQAAASAARLHRAATGGPGLSMGGSACSGSLPSTPLPLPTPPSLVGTFTFGSVPSLAGSVTGSATGTTAAALPAELSLTSLRSSAALVSPAAAGRPSRATSRATMSVAAAAAGGGAGTAGVPSASELAALRAAVAGMSTSGPRSN